MIDDLKTAVSVRYEVKLDEQKLGEFTGCEGLGVEVVLESREEGGNNLYVWQFPTRLKYPNIKLSRPVYEGSSEMVINWILSTTGGMKRSTGSIVAKTSKGAVVASWAINDVIPVRWTGPGFSSDQPKVLTETLEIAHHGFISTGAKY
ncbi:phage tail protein [Agromyces sp. LHK192]|uniref:phage tail protein n=1 Tax=Agromyces sp. LHK192 TaxID=2498704 RepID=UPI000FD900B5|nr:phage tail protein [Agromyces sp. LHK192]